MLTASEPRAQDAGQNAPTPIQIPVTGGMSEEIVDQIAETIVRKLEQAAVPK